MKKNNILLLLILSFSMIGLMVSAHDIEVPNADGVMIYYNYINDGTELEVSFLGGWYGFVDNEYSGVVVIPEKVILEERTLEVTSIGSSAFSGCHEMTSITIPNSVTSIGSNAFYDCCGLSSVNLPNSLTSIADWTFADCSGLTSVSIPNSVTKIGDYAFDGCYCLPSVTIPSSVTTIGVSAFGLCAGLTSITIPNSVTTIGDYAFEGCNYLTSVSIGEGVTSIGVYAFAGCLRLPSIIIPDGVTSIADFTFYKCYALASVAIGSGVTSIGKYAFQECMSLTSVTIPESVTTIGEWAFSYCTSLTTITIPSSVTTIGNSAFFNCYDLVAVNISDLEAFCKIQFEGDCFYLHYLYLNGERIKNLSIPESLTSIGNYAFDKCLGFTSITIPNSVTSIGYNAFFHCSNLSSVTIGNSVNRIGNCAFSFCTGLKDMYCYAEQVPEIGNDIFTHSNQANATLHVPASSVGAYRAAEQWKDFKEIVALPVQDDYRNMVKDGMVWKTGIYGSGNPVQHVEYFYFDGDTIIDGKTCKQMMCQQYFGPDASDDTYTSQLSPLSYVGAWYEEDKKVYTYDTTSKQFMLMYDFSVDANDTLQINQDDYYVIGPRQTGGLRGFKGVYRDVWFLAEDGPIYSPTWLEGVGGIDGPTTNVYPGYVDPLRFLMSCTVDDEVIYFNDEYEDGATPEELNANKNRFDFTHTVKTQPKAPSMGEEERSKGVASADIQLLYGEYNQQQLSIHLDPLDETYMVCITNESNEIVYEKTINTVDIVGLNIDISTYAKGRYTATVENSNESFVGEFEVQATGIETIINKKKDARTYIYNLQGQRIRFLQKGLNIVNGRKIYVK